MDSAAGATPAAPSAAGLTALAARYPDVSLLVLTQLLASPMCGGSLARLEALLQESFAVQTQQQQQQKAAKKRTLKSASNSTCNPHGWYDSSCGYCGSKRENPKKKTSRTFSMTCATLRPSDYQSLIDVGWRRSGDYLYKQNNFDSCCTHYTIRLNVHKFKPDKALRKAMAKFERFLAGHPVSRHADDEDAPATVAAAATSERKMDTSDSIASNRSTLADPYTEVLRTQLLAAIQSLIAVGTLPASLQSEVEKLLRVYPYVDPTAAKKKGAAKNKNDASTMDDAVTASAAVTTATPAWNYTSNAALVLSGALKKIGGALQTPVSLAEMIIRQSSLQAAVGGPGYINIHLPGVRAVTPRSRASSIDAKSHQRTPAPAAPAAASVAPTDASAASSVALTPHTFEIRCVPANEHNEEAFQVYRKYQKAIHKDDDAKLTPSQYEDFLGSAPFIKEGGPGSPYGGFHMHYLIDGKIVAVGVVDILPSCLSSVYLFYDPAFEYLNLGTVTALKEIEYIQTHLTPTHRALKYYYLGYYIHTCQKMRYKRRYQPSELLCPVRCTWHPLDACRPALDSLTVQLQAPAGTSHATAGASESAPSVSSPPLARCVILSDVAPESREEDGSLPVYRSPSLVLRHTDNAVPTSAALGTAAITTGALSLANGEKQSKRKRKGENTAAAAPSAASIAATEAATASFASASLVNAAAATATPAIASSPSPSSLSSSSSVAFPLIDATHPYVFSRASKEAAAAHRRALAQSLASELKIGMKEDHRTEYLQLTQLTATGRQLILDYISLVGAEIARTLNILFQ